MFERVGVSCRVLHSFVGYLYVSGGGSIISVGGKLVCLLLFTSNYVVSVGEVSLVGGELVCLLLFTSNYVVSVGEVSSSSGYLGWATLFNCGTP